MRITLLIRGRQPEKAVSRTCGSSLYFFQKEATELKNRKRQRDNRRIKQREERIDKRNNYGVKDLTADNAVRQIRTNGKAPFAELTAKASL